MSTYDYLFRGIPFDERLYLQDGGGVPPVQGEKRLDEVEIPTKYSQMDDNREDVLDFYRSMLNSKWYKDRLKKNGYGDGLFDKFIRIFNRKYDGVNSVIEKRLNNINNTTITRADRGVVADEFGREIPYQEGYVTSSYNIPKSKMFDNGMNLLLDESEMDFRRIHPSDLLAHELGHSENI